MDLKENPVKVRCMSDVGELWTTVITCFLIVSVKKRKYFQYPILSLYGLVEK